MANIKYLTLDGLTHFKSKLDKLFAAHISGSVTSEGISLYLNNNITSTAASGSISGDTYENIDSVQIPGATATHAGAMLPSHVQKLNALPTAAFTKITNGTSSIIADSATDELTLTAATGISITFTPSADKITIGHADTSSVTTDAVGPGEDTTQQAETTLEFTVPYITVDDFGHVTGLESRTITVKDTNTKTTKDGHYTPEYTDGEVEGEVKRVTGTPVTNDGNTVTFLQSVLVDGKNHITQATYGTINIPVYPDIPNLEVTTTTTGTGATLGNVVTSVKENGEHKITVTKGLSVYSKVEVDAAIDAAKKYADNLELSKFDFKGNLTIDANTTTANGPKVHNVGDIYRIATAGTYFGSTYEYQVGDFVLCTTSGTAANAAHWASLNTNWQVVTPETNVPTITASSTGTIIATIGGVDIKAKIDSYITSVNAGTGINVEGSTTPTISLKSAATDQIGGIKVWDKTSSYTVTATKSPTIDKNVNGGQYYAVQTDKNNKAFVYVPWKNDNTTYTASQGLLITNKQCIETVRVTEQSATGSMTVSSYITKAPILLDNNAMYTEIQNITNSDIDALF